MYYTGSVTGAFGSGRNLSTASIVAQEQLEPSPSHVDPLRIFYVGMVEVGPDPALNKNFIG